MTGYAIEPLQGVIAPILTPFNDDLSVAHDLFTAHALALLDQGCVGLAPFATAGEGPSISRAERTNALWHLTQAGISPAKLVPGTGLPNLHETAALSRACMDMGCGGVLVLPPYFFMNVPEDGLYAYYAQVIDTVGDDLRMYLYHIPQVSGVGLPFSLVQRLKASFPEQVVGIYDASSDRDYIKALMRIENLIVYTGSETSLLETIPLGAQGCITPTANVSAGPIAEFITAILEDDTMGVESMRGAIDSVRKIVAARDFIMTPKRLLAIQTGDERWANARPPFISAPEVAGQALIDALAAAG